MSKNPKRSYQRPSSKRRPASKKNARSTPTIVAVAVVAVVVIVALVWWNGRSSVDQSILNGLVQTYASEGATHIPYGQQASYRSNPPHSGPHYASPTNPGFYRSQIPDEVIVHNLEHGHVVLYYKPGSLSEEDQQYLTALSSAHNATWAAFLSVPRQEMDAPLVLAAWRNLLPMETLDREIVAAFIDRFIGRGPENPVR